jgi:hypothetical protein
MDTTSFEPLLRNAMIRALDSISKKAAETEKAAEGAITRLLKRWHKMDEREKENVAAFVIATAVTAVGAIAAIKSRGKKEKKEAKKPARKTAKKPA